MEPVLLATTRAERGLGDGQGGVSEEHGSDGLQPNSGRTSLLPNREIYTAMLHLEHLEPLTSTCVSCSYPCRAEL